MGRGLIGIWMKGAVEIILRSGSPTNHFKIKKPAVSSVLWHIFLRMRRFFLTLDTIDFLYTQFTQVEKKVKK